MAPRPRPRPVRLIAAILLVLGALIVAPTPAQAGLGFDAGHVDLGKVEPGHRSQHHWNVTNTGAEAVTVNVEVQCGCAIYVTAEPGSLELGAGETETVVLKVDVADDADPGIHDYTVRFVERASNAQGGTAQGAVARNIQFQVEAAAIFIDGRSEPGALGARFVSAFAESLDVEVIGTLTHDGSSRALDPVTFEARGSANGSAVTRFSVDLGLDDASPVGTYKVSLDATWSNTDTGRSGGQSGVTHTFTHGTVLTLTDFETELLRAAVAFSGTITNHGSSVRTVWMEVELTEAGSPDPVVVKSDARELAAGASARFAAEWSQATGTDYTVVAYAVAATEDGKGSGERGQAVSAGELSLPAGKHRSTDAAAASTAQDKENQLPGAGGSAFLNDNMKLVIGVVVGAVFAVTITLAITKKRD